MISIRKHDVGAPVEDMQHRLAKLGYLPEENVSGVFDDATAFALEAFCREHDLPATDEVDERVWSALVDAGFELGDRTLYLRMPHFHGNDVLQLQNALGALGFACGGSDGIFGAYTELALRKFQTNLGLYRDGIAGAATFDALAKLHCSWEGKSDCETSPYLGFARAADVLERRALCLFGTCPFTRSVASRMSNLANATNPASKVVSADALSVAPGDDMLLVHICLPGQPLAEGVPCVSYEPEGGMSRRIASALSTCTSNPCRIALKLPGETWEDAKPARSAQHFAIVALDNLCAALAELPEGDGR